MSATAIPRLACATAVLFACAWAPAHATTFVAQYVPPSPIQPAPLSPGLHVFVTDGLIHLSNQGGSLNFSAGQFGYVSSSTLPPLIVPANPTLRFTPPPAFLPSLIAPTGGFSPTNTVECEVR